MSLLTEAFWEAVEDLLTSLPASEDSVQKLISNSLEAYQTGDYRRAMLVSGAAWRLASQVLGPEHPDTLTSLSDLSVALNGCGDHTEAETLQRKVLDTTRLVHGPEHPSTLMRMDNLAGTLQARGDLLGAKAIQKEVVELYRCLLGSDNPNTLISIGSLSKTLFDEGNISSAESLQREAADGFRRVLGREHRHTLTSNSILSTIMHARGDTVGAEAIEREVYEIRLRTLPLDHPDTQISMNNLAGYSLSRGAFVEAESIFRKILHIRQQSLGSEHPDTLLSMLNLAHTIFIKTEFREAAQLQWNVFNSSSKLLGPDHKLTVKSMNNLVGSLQALGDLTAAETISRNLLETNCRVRGWEHPDTIIGACGLAFMLLTRGDLPSADEAESLLSSSSDVIDRLRGAAGDDIAQAHMGGAMKAGPLNVTLAALRAKLHKPESLVLKALERSSGRAAIGILSRGGRGTDQLIKDRSNTDELKLYMTQRQRIDKLAMRRDIIQNQLAEKDCPNRSSLHANLMELSDEISSLRHELRVIVSKVLPESRIRELDEIRSAVRSGELLVSIGHCWLSAAAVIIPHRDDATAFVLCEDREEIRKLDAVSALFSMGISPHASRTPDMLAALEMVMADKDLVMRLKARTIEDCDDRINRMVEIFNQARKEESDAREAGRSVDRRRIEMILSQPVPSLTIDTLGALARELLCVLLPDQIRAAMAKAERIVVVPSGPLLELPLNLLIEAAGIEELMGKPITYTPSASIFALQRQTDHYEGKGLSIAGDPYFGPEDESAEDQVQVGAVRMRDLRSGHKRLPRTRSEAEQIEALFTKAGQSTTHLLLDEAASVPNVRTTSPGCRYVHLASHAKLGGPSDPMSSAIVLAVPEVPSAEDTGYLTLEELIGGWGGKLRGCSLVTLSACQSTASVEVGDSMMALPLGLLHAGARCVLASLWSVPDMPTWLLMRRFYENLLGIRHDEDTAPRAAHGKSYELGNPMPATASLAEAQRWLKTITLVELVVELDEAGGITTDESNQMKRWKTDEVLYPFESALNWAAFVIIGDGDNN